MLVDRYLLDSWLSSTSNTFLSCWANTDNKETNPIHKYRAISPTIIANSCLYAWWCTIWKISRHIFLAKISIGGTNDPAALQQYTIVVVLSRFVLAVWPICFFTGFWQNSWGFVWGRLYSCFIAIIQTSYINLLLFEFWSIGMTQDKSFE